MITKIMTKPDTQKLIRILKNGGVEMQKQMAGYVGTFEGKEVFRAMNGSRGYLIRIEETIGVL